MSDNPNKDTNCTGASPIALAQSLTPSWMMLINDFVGLEIHPCKVIGHAQGSPIVMTCKPEEASFWVVFGHYPMSAQVGGFDALENFPTEAEARKFRDRLLEAYPHLAGDRSYPRQQPQSKLTP